jgi:hypothetical protein
MSSSSTRRARASSSTPRGDPLQDRLDPGQVGYHRGGVGPVTGGAQVDLSGQQRLALSWRGPPPLREHEVRRGGG